MSEASETCSRVAIIDKVYIATIDAPEKLRTTISSCQYVEVSFVGTAPKHNELELLPGVSQIDSDNRTFRLYTKLPDQVMTEVVRLADRRGLEITDLSNRKPSLEDVFLHLTRWRKQRGLQ
jgi:ABC-2 type transport system ATP-binding protein